mmetsp:Transcript_9452/g.21419  ORF Transcript_9452/g.21419 Transcript_9452/m.21419 type:complete len:635 (-) Transcript_9452:149-2053(-)
MILARLLRICTVAFPPSCTTVQFRSPPRRRSISTRLLADGANHISGFDMKSIAGKCEVGAPPKTGGNAAADERIQLLEKWIKHDDHSFHFDHLSEQRSYEIRVALVSWYRQNRRKLPWRGDEGPFDGSTIGFASRSNSKRKGDGGDIRSFFDASSSKKIKTGEGSKGHTLEAQQSRGVATPVTPYSVWVSEIMLQQTRVEAVIPYYLKWMQSFPTVVDLAKATEEEVNSHWAGLGFYRRARLLHAGAKRVVEEFNGELPSTVKDLLRIEGIGKYTASAVASIAFNVDVPVVDGNVCRVLSRLTGIANNIKAPVLKDDLGWDLAARIIDARSIKKKSKKPESYDVIGYPGEVNQALMELGATYCAPSGTGIEDGDPLKGHYLSTELGRAVGQVLNASDRSERNRIELLVTNSDNKKGCKLTEPGGISTAYFSIVDKILQEKSKLRPSDVHAIAGHQSLPTPPPKKSKTEEVLAVAVLSSTKGGEKRWLMVKRPKDGLLASQWEFPSVSMWNSKDGRPKGGQKKGKRTAEVLQVPTIDVSKRTKELGDFLTSSLLVEDIAAIKRKQCDHPIEHTFSHIKWHMNIECADVGERNDDNRWKSSDGREVAWLSEDDMQAVGITSSVRKALYLTLNDKEN